MKLRIPLSLRAVMLGAASICSIAPGYSDSSISTPDDLLSAFQNGGEYILLNNIEIPSVSPELSGGTLVIDLNRHTIDYNNASRTISVEYGAALHLSDGTLTGMNSPGYYAYVIHNKGTLYLDNVVIEGNYGNSICTGIRNSGSDGEARLYMKGGAIINNTTYEREGRGYGAGLWNYGSGLDVKAFAELDGVRLINNVNRSGFGGAICNGSEYGLADLFVRNCYFDGNSAMEVNDWPNEAGSSTGGGAIINIAGYVTIVDSSFYNNYSDLGGALLNRHQMTIRAENSDVVFQNNYMMSTYDNREKGNNDIYLNSFFNVNDQTNTENPEYLNVTWLEATHAREIVFHGGIRGLNNDFMKDSEGNNVTDPETGRTVYDKIKTFNNLVNINYDSEGEGLEGMVVFKKTAIVRSINLSLYNGTMVVEHEDVFYNARDKFDSLNDLKYLRHRNNFAMYGGTLDLSSFLTGTFSIGELILSHGAIKFGTVREFHDQSLIMGTYGWTESNPVEIVFQVDCLGHYNKKMDYVLLDYVDIVLTEDDLKFFTLSAGQYGDDWSLIISDGDLVLHWEGEDDGGGGTCPDPHDPEPCVPEVRDFEKKGTLVENSLLSSDSNLRAMGNTAMSQLNIVLLKSGSCRNLWVRGLGDFVRQSSTESRDGFEYSGGGYSVGYDHKLAEGRGYLGAAFGQVWGKNQSLDYSANINQRTMMGTLYWGNLVEATRDSAWLLKGAASYGNTNNKLQAYFSDGNNSTGKWDNRTWYLQTEASYRMDQGNGWVFAPYVGLEYSRSSRNSFHDTMSYGEGRAFGSSHLERMTIPTGLQADNLSRLGEKPWLNTFRLGYVGDVMRHNPESMGYMAGEEPWRVNSSRVSRNALRAEYNTLVILNQNWQAYAGYSIEVRSHSTYQQVNAGVNYSF